MLNAAKVLDDEVGSVDEQDVAQQFADGDTEEGDGNVGTHEAK